MLKAHKLSEVVRRELEGDLKDSRLFSLLKRGSRDQCRADVSSSLSDVSKMTGRRTEDWN